MHILVYMYMGLNTHTCMLTFLPYPHHTCWYKYFMKERGMGTLLIEVRYRCREMMLEGHLAWYHWEKWSINRGNRERILIWQHSLSSFLTPKTPPFYFAAGQNSSSPRLFPLHFFTHPLSFPLIPSQIFPFLPLYQKGFLYLFYLLQRSP